MNDLTPAGSPFDSIRRLRPDGSEYWPGRELMPLMDYAQWVKFVAVIEKARDALALIEGTEQAEHHFPKRETDGGRWGNQLIEDYELTRLGAYLTAMAGDDTKRAVAEARIYFAVNTRKQEIAEQQQHFEIPQSFAEALELAARKVREVEALEQRNAELVPLAAAEEHHRSAHGLKAVGDFANDLKAWAKTNHPDVKVKHQDVWAHLARLGMVIRGDTVRHNQPTAKAVEQGWCVPKVSDYDTSEGARSSTTTRLTPKGEGYAWDRITAYVEANGTLELPRRIGPVAS